MKKGFTLIELLIVVVVLVTLMTITFRLSSIGSDTSKRNTTIARLQRLENCLSGYYAAYGTYPPVRLHNSRNYKLAVSSHGIQNLDGNEADLKWSWYNAGSHYVEDSEAEAEDWEKVQAACRAQPVACRFPFPNTSEWQAICDAASEEVARLANENESLSESRKQALAAGFTIDMRGSLGGYTSKTEWRDLQLFQFGLMSFLLPRYLVMMDGDDDFFEHAQWTDNNTLPCDAMDGSRFGSWRRVQERAQSEDASDLARVANIPSQAACSRWIANLAGICRSGNTFTIFGVNLGDGEGIPATTSIEIFSPGGYDEDSTSGQYVLDGVTVQDGWERDFYYYSPAPYQSYVLWSAGVNGKTFPPWVDRESLDSKARECVGYWTEDDIAGMSN